MQTFIPPSAQFLMGTDAFGRDLLSRVLYGGRTTIVARHLRRRARRRVGTTLGLIAGYFRGTTGFVIMRLIDLLLAFPLFCWRSRFPRCLGRAW